jgi:hypothetical protein
LLGIRQHTSAYVGRHTWGYVSIRQHTSAYVSIRQSGRGRRCLPAYVSIHQHTSAALHQHTSAYVRIRQHTSAYVRAAPASAFCVRICTFAPVKQVKRVNLAGGGEVRPAACAEAERMAASAARSCTTSAYVSIRQHTSAYVSIRQHTSGGRPVQRGAALHQQLQRSVSICTFVPVKQLK